MTDLFTDIDTFLEAAKVRQEGRERFEKAMERNRVVKHIQDVVLPLARCRDDMLRMAQMMRDALRKLG